MVWIGLRPRPGGSSGRLCGVAKCSIGDRGCWCCEDGDNVPVEGCEELGVDNVLSRAEAVGMSCRQCLSGWEFLVDDALLSRWECRQCGRFRLPVLQGRTDGCSSLLGAAFAVKADVARAARAARVVDFARRRFCPSSVLPESSRGCPRCGVAPAPIPAATPCEPASGSIDGRRRLRLSTGDSVWVYRRVTASAFIDG